MNTKTGIWLIGACGNVAALTFVGARAMARGLAGRTGMVTELKELRELPLVPVEEMVFGGHEISGRTVLEASGVRKSFRQGPCGGDLRSPARRGCSRPRGDPV